MIKFRLNAKKLYLTYSQIDSKITHTYILDFLKTKLIIGEYLISLEHHEDGGLHAHVLLILTKRCNFVTSDCLDLSFQEKSYHGNYQTAKQVKA